MSEKMHFLLANTQALGIATGMHEWGWSRDHVRNDCLRNHENEQVRLVSSGGSLASFLKPPGTKIYLARHWIHAHGDARSVVERLRSEGYAIIDDGRK